MPQEL